MPELSHRHWITSLLGEGAFARLASGLSGSELTSLLLEVLRIRARARTPAEVLAQQGRDRFCLPAHTSLRTSVAIDARLLEAAAAFEALELSPLAPLAACSAVSPTDQHRVVSTARGTEVVSDPTNVLALECARRLRGGAGAAVHLCTSQRVVRAQAPPAKAGHAAHFRLFALASGGLEAQGHAFTVEALALHITTLLAGLLALERDGYRLGARRLELRATPARAALAGQLQALVEPVVPVSRSALEHPYYSGGLRYLLWVTAPDGEELSLGDGGAFDWLQRLNSNRRLAFVASGLGAQLVPVRFGR